MSTRAIKKWSDLRGLAVVTLESGAKVGNIEDFYFEPQSNMIRAFRVKTGLMSRKILASGIINGIGQNAVTIQDEGQLRNEKDENGLNQMVPAQALMSYRIMSAGGTVIGNIGEILLDITNPLEMRVDGYELSRNLLQHLGQQAKVFSSSQVNNYGQDVVVIPDDVALSLK